MKFLLAACLVCATLPLYAETEFADITVTTDFSGGSADLKSIGRKSGVIHITPKIRSERGWPCWWYLKVEGAKKEQLIILKLTATVFELAKTRGGRSVQGIRIGDAAKQDSARYGIWIQARQHAWEAGSSWVGRGFVEWLASDDPAAAKLRSSATVYYVPIMDVDNVSMGAGGKDAVPRDHNRDWDDNPYYPEVAAAQKRILKLNADGEFDVFVDLHNPGGSERRPYFFGPINLEKLPAIQQQNHARWLAVCNEAISGPLPLEPRYKFATYVRTDEERNRMSANWVRNQTAGHVLSTTLETVWNTQHSTQQGYMTVGAQLGIALTRYLELNPRGQVSGVIK